MLYDKDIRESLYDYLEETWGKIRIIEEKRIGRSRADLVMVLPGAVAGIEIKSDADTYVRLSGQVVDYDRLFDYNILVAGSVHAAHAHEHVPEHWGIVIVEEAEKAGEEGAKAGGADFYMLRRPKRREGLDIREKLQLLWRPELAQLQEKNELPRYRDKSKAFVIELLAERVAPELLHEQISEALFERDYTTIGETIDAYRRSIGRRPARRRRRKQIMGLGQRRRKRE